MQVGGIMKKEKLTEKIKLEYDLFEVDHVYRIEHVFDMIGYSLRVANTDISYLSRVKNHNRRYRFISRLFGEDAVEYGLYKPDFYDKDNKLISLQSKIILEHRRRMNELFEILDEDNMQEVYRLGMFAMNKHYQNSVCMTGSRALLKCDGANYACMTLTMPMDEVGFQDFFDSELNKIKSIKAVEFSKK